LVDLLRERRVTTREVLVSGVARMHNRGARRPLATLCPGPGGVEQVG
jgi:hypothetical protein